MARGALPLLAVTYLLCPAEALAFCRTTSCTCASQATCATDCPKDSNGCSSTGVPLAWSGGCVGFSLDVAGTSALSADQWTDAIVQAFDAWMTADCGGGRPPSIDLLQLRDVDCARTGYDPHGPNANVVYFSDDGWNGTNIDGTLALTTLTFADSGEILGAAMAINSSENDFTVGDGGVQQDLVSVVTHEVGHFLGIGHSPEPTAVMYYSYAEGTIRRTLTPDDVAAVCAAYPPGEQKTCDPTPPGGLATSCGSTSGGSTSGGCNVSSLDGHDGDGSLLGALLAAAGVGARGIVKRRSLR